MPHPAFRFVLLRHELPAGGDRPSHWDLLLEREDACWTWAIEELPAGLVAAGESKAVAAKRLPDHRKHYLDYEGPVSEGRGTVTRELGGECEWLEASDARVCVQLISELGPCELTVEQERGDTWRVTTC